MAFTINFNPQATSALSILNQTNNNLAQTQERISSGLKVAGAKDDASTFSIAQGLRSNINAQKTIQDTIALGLSTVDVAVSAVENITKTLDEIEEKIIQSQSENVDRRILQNDIDRLIEQVGDQVSGANFNGTNLLQGGTDDFKVLLGQRGEELNVQNEDLRVDQGFARDNGVSGVGSNTVIIDFTTGAVGGAVAAGQLDSIAFSVEDTATGEVTSFTADLKGVTDDATFETAIIDAFTDAGLAPPTAAQITQPAVDQQSIEVATGQQVNAVAVNRAGSGLEVLNEINVNTGTGVAAETDRSAALAAIDSAKQQVRDANARLGGSQDRLDQQGEFLGNLVDSLQSGLSTLVDADLTEESVNLSKLQTQQQLGFQTLGIAGQQTQGLLALFR